MKKIKSYSYSLSDDNKLTIFVKTLNNQEYSAATISDVKEKDCDKIAKEVLKELNYKIIEGNADGE